METIELLMWINFQVCGHIVPEKGRQLAFSGFKLFELHHQFFHLILKSGNIRKASQKRTLKRVTNELYMMRIVES